MQHEKIIREERREKRKNVFRIEEIKKNTSCSVTQ
jgi:hypothetical protein